MVGTEWFWSNFSPKLQVPKDAQDMDTTKWERAKESHFSFPLSIDFCPVIQEIQCFMKKHEFILHGTEDILVSINGGSVFSDNSIAMQSLLTWYQIRKLKKAINSLIKDHFAFKFDILLTLPQRKKGFCSRYCQWFNCQVN